MKVSPLNIVMSLTLKFLEFIIKAKEHTGVICTLLQECWGGWEVPEAAKVPGPSPPAGDTDSLVRRTMTLEQLQGPLFRLVGWVFHLKCWCRVLFDQGTME